MTEADIIQNAVELAVNHADWIIGFSSFLVFGMALTAKQRLAIREDRDNDRCHAPFRHYCNGYGKDKALNVHHITPQRWSREHLGQTEEEFDVPENLITLCTNAHDMIHPDNLELRASYRMGDQNPALVHRDELCNDGTPYWYQGFDKEMKEKAKLLTEKAKKEKGWTFPLRIRKHL